MHCQHDLNLAFFTTLESPEYFDSYRSSFPLI